MDEFVGSVELCVSYGGSNVPPTVDGTVTNVFDGKWTYCFLRLCECENIPMHLD